MKSKLAIWSWVLPIVGLFVTLSMSKIAERIGHCGYINFETYNQTFGCSFVNAPEFKLFLVGLAMVSALSGLIFGIITLVKIKNNPNISGKIQAVVGIIFSLILFIFSLFGLHIALFGVSYIGLS